MKEMFGKYDKKLFKCWLGKINSLLLQKIYKQSDILLNCDILTLLFI